MQKPTSDAHSNTYSINANFEGISYVLLVIILSIAQVYLSNEEQMSLATCHNPTGLQFSVGAYIPQEYHYLRLLAA